MRQVTIMLVTSILNAIAASQVQYYTTKFAHHRHMGIRIGIATTLRCVLYKCQQFYLCMAIFSKRASKFPFAFYAKRLYFLIVLFYCISS